METRTEGRKALGISDHWDISCLQNLQALRIPHSGGEGLQTESPVIFGTHLQRGEWLCLPRAELSLHCPVHTGTLISTSHGLVVHRGSQKEPIPYLGQ